MKEVKRYNMRKAGHYPFAQPHPEGELIRATDFDAVLKERDLFDEQSTRWMLLAERNAKDRDALQGKLKVAVEAMKMASAELDDDCPITAARCIREALAQLDLPEKG